MKARKTLTIVAIMLIVIGIIGGALTFNDSEASAEPEIQTIDSEGIEQIEIGTTNADVNVSPGNHSEIKVELTGKRTDEPRLDVSNQNGTALIQTKDHKKLFSIDFFQPSKVLTIHIPKKTFASLSADLDNGRFHAKQVNIDHLQVETTNGRVEVDETQANHTDLQSTNGKINLQYVTGQISANTTNGAISLVVSHLDRPISLKTTNGKINIDTETKPENATFDVQTTNGRVNIFGNDGNRIIGNGEHLIKLRTTNGSVTVE